jgi:hypothetical protein
MKLPARFRYDPRWQITAFIWAIAAALAIVALTGYLPRALGVALSALFAGGGVLLTLRRFVFTRSVVLDEEGVWLPSGFMRTKVRRVVFAEVSAVWEAFLPLTVVLCLRCHGKTFEVVSTLFPDHETYLTVGGYIYSRTAQGHEDVLACE